MPFTAFHASPVWIIYLLKPKKFDWIGLTVGAIIPDFLEPLMITIFVKQYWEVRIWTHSLLGAITVMTLFAAFLAIYIVPKLLGYLTEKYKDKRFHTFAGIDILKERGSNFVILYSAFIGTLSHIILDLFFHTRNPILHPHREGAILLFGDLTISMVITTLISGGLFIYISYKYWWKGESP
jgi:hypothetical protein